MGVRKTESRIPANFKPEDLGQAVVSDDGRCTLISFVTAPIVVNRKNVYVLFVTDAGLATATQSFEWTFEENGDITKTQTTEISEIAYLPQTTGTLNITLRLLDAGKVEQAKLVFEQEVVLPSVEIETFITDAQNKPGPGAANPDVLRELVNEHSRYYQAVKLQTPETGDSFKSFTFSMVLNGALQRTVGGRKQQVEQLAATLNGQGSDFVGLAAAGVGVCGIRLALLAMTLPQAPSNPAPLLSWSELPEPMNQRTFADEQLRQMLAALDENTRTDLFNIARFPKSNITQCGRILETLRNRYFTGTTFNDVLTGMSGTRAHWITRHYEEGPILRS
jgi:hypothetical protein